MSRSFKKVVAVLSAIAMIVTGITIQPKAVSADDYSALTYTQVGEKDYWVAAGNDDFPFQMIQDQGDQFLIIPQVAAGTKPIWPNFTNATLNGTTFNQPAGAGIYIKYADLTDNAYNVFEATSAVDDHRFQIIIKAGTPVEGETTTADPDAPTTTPAPTTTTELQAPAAPAGLVANINDLKTNYTIAFANVATATSYKLYLDDTYVKDITNGGVVTIEELGLEAGKTYTFGVSAVNAAGESAISTVQVTVPSVEETTTPGSAETTPAVETTTEAPTEAFDPSTITDWKAVTNSTTMSYYIANGAADRVSVKPEMHGDNLYAAYKIAAKFKSVSLNGEAIEPRAGADVEIAKTSFKEGYNKLEVTDTYGNETVTIYFKVEKEPETTTAPYTDGEVLVNESNVTKEVPAYEGGDYWQNEYNNMPVNYVAGKKYVAEVVVSSTAAKAIKLVFQRVGDWDFVDANGGYEAQIAAGNKVKITYVFEAKKSTDNGNFDIYLGSVADATTLTFESKKLTTYNEVPEGVQTGVEVLETQSEEPTVTVDGKDVTVENGKVTLGDAEYGYYADGKMYKPGTEVEVTEDMAFTSVNTLSVARQNGAGIRYQGTAGIRFQATVASDNMTAVSSDAITEGMLITAKDIYEAHDSVLDLTSAYTTINVKNSGWYNGTEGTFCASVCNIVESNYIRNFVAKAYVTITYTDGTSTTVYSNVPEARSISYVASAVKNAGYPGIADEFKSVIDSFIK